MVGETAVFIKDMLLIAAGAYIAYKVVGKLSKKKDKKK